MAPNYSKYLTKNNAYVTAALAAASWVAYSKLQKKGQAPKRKVPKVEEEIKYMITEKKQAKLKAHVGAKFFKELLELLKVVIPGWATAETGLLALIAATLISRSLCDLYMVNYFARIESAIVGMNKHLFWKRISIYLALTPIISVINNLLKYSIGELKICITSNMTNHLYADYLKKYTYYRVTNLDKRIANVDQLLTTDINKFCDTLVDLYCNLTKPVLDICIYVYKLNTNLGYSTPGLMLSYLAISAFLLTHLRRPVGVLTVNEQKLEGEFRHINSRMITHSEEIAFYNGNIREKATLISSFNKLVRHMRKFLRFRVLMGVVDNVIAKYFAFFVGYTAMAIPFFSTKNGLSELGQETRSVMYYIYGAMMVRLGMAIGRLVLAGREMTKLAGYTVRVSQLRQVLKDINEDKYERTMIAGSGIGDVMGKLIFKNNVIKFDKVPIVTPNGDVLIKELSVEVKSGTNVLVCGPNGAGKSSLFRILGELWPLFGGELTKPPRGKLFYIPQRPYMTLGNLRDQITYPHSGSEAKRRGCTDEKLEQHLQRVQLEYLLERDGKFDAVADWLEVLSGGEKQRIAMARLFYHAPQFAILDECTSAVSLDIEDSMYKYCKEVGITLFTVSHRKSLWQHHEYVLHLDGRGDYSFQAIEDDMEKFGS